jgi:hypothetical protein
LGNRKRSRRGKRAFFPEHFRVYDAFEDTDYWPCHRRIISFQAAPYLKVIARFFPLHDYEQDQVKE